MTTHQTTAETGAAIFAKAAPPATVSLASLAGIPVSELVLWCTLVYTVLMIGHKAWQIYQDVRKP